MVGPLDAHRFTVNVALELLEQGIALVSVLDCLKVVSHLSEERLLVDSAVQFSESLVAFVISHSIQSIST